MPPTIETWFDAIGKVALTITGVNAVFAGGRAGVDDAVQPMIDEELLVTPAVVLALGDFDVLAGSWEAQKHQVELGLWIERHPIATAYAECIAFRDRVMAAFPPRAKAFALHPELMSVLVTGGRAPRPRTWPENSDRQYLVSAMTLEVELRRAAQYEPA